MNEQELVAIVGDFAQRYFSRVLGVDTEELEGVLTDESGNIRDEYANKLQELIPSLGEDFWEVYQEDPDQAITTLIEQEQSTSEFKRGGKLEYLSKLKKGGKMKRKKCACGCDIVTKVAKGGKITSTCACGCGGKMEDGGKIKKDKNLSNEETWESSGKGNNSMNPNDWKRSKTELADTTSSTSSTTKKTLPPYMTKKKVKFPIKK